MSIGKKISKALKRQWNTARKTHFGFTGKWAGNPYTHGLWATRDIIRGITKGRAASNAGKYLSGAKRSVPVVSVNSASGWSTIPGTTFRRYT